ncbi:hypothetical protein CEP54_009180 [Fusarium duplospermum]|uniref:Uncharacterized protein n=1 Tax=Fusarium duplospermum TaxID=1325734 RepID=A0A428PRX2_9HYPO|nr:hypothetical protein CEP54_009180 [Fusarium duplospermum]
MNRNGLSNGAGHDRNKSTHEQLRIEVGGGKGRVYNAVFEARLPEEPRLPRCYNGLGGETPVSRICAATMF